MRSILTGFLLLFCASFSYAVIIDNGAFTTDTDTGLDWLDLTETRFISYVEMEQMLLPGGAYYGWRFATAREFEALVLNFGFVLPEDCNGDLLSCNPIFGGDSLLIEYMIKTLGDTYEATLNDRERPEGSHNVIADDGAGYARGYLLHEGPTYASEFSAYLGGVYDYEQVDSEFGFVIVDHDDSLGVYGPEVWLNEGDATQGSFLVRSTVVPTPAAAWLFISGIAGLTGWRKLKG